MKRICLWIGVVIAAIAVIVIGFGILKAKTYNPKKPIATIEFEGYETKVKIELDPVSSPNAVANFVKLANGGFYNDYKMVIDGKEIVSDSSQEKAKLSRIVGSPKDDYVYGIKGDIIANGVDNYIRHKKGVITMHRNDYSYFGFTEEGYNSANSTFGILAQDNEGYDQYYAAFGKVIEGMDVIEAISASAKETETSEDANSQADKKTIKIKSITVDTFGVSYDAPEYTNYEENLKKVNDICKQYFGSDYESLFK